MDVAGPTWSHVTVLVALALAVGVVLGSLIWARVNRRRDSVSTDDMRWALLLASRRYTIRGPDPARDAAQLCQAAVHFLYFVQPLELGCRGDPVVPSEGDPGRGGTTR